MKTRAEINVRDLASCPCVVLVFLLYLRISISSMNVKQILFTSS